MTIGVDVITEFKQATPEYWEFIRYVRNSTKQGFITQEYIDEDTHYTFMAKHWRSYYILLADYGRGLDKGKLGFIGIVNDDIRFGLLPSAQGHGLGTEMLRFIKEKYPNAYGRVKVDNIASNKAFEKAGYLKFEREDFHYFYNSEEYGENHLLKFLKTHLMKCVFCNRTVPSLENEKGLAVCKKCENETACNCKSSGAFQCKYNLDNSGTACMCGCHWNSQ